ncbi:hypothetical protein AK812_SmicGene7909 [Symbiodinium microadriaticum]|uniref:Uncharacterized protein n=1 Tax=Symbiodinium microadriaticum TaxID=2951 RepID=A0A1Q9EM79_SYMMI|nr:hypothetical protein AK812_SmicGene7909 [Symbiodinium microadriaticum]
MRTAQFRPVEGDKPPTPRDSEASAVGAAGPVSSEPTLGALEAFARARVGMEGSNQVQVKGQPEAGCHIAAKCFAASRLFELVVQARQNARAAGVGGRAHGEERETDKVLEDAGLSALKFSDFREAKYLGGGESAADVFARAEAACYLCYPVSNVGGNQGKALCEAQRFSEAAELFRCVLAALRSLDDIAAAIESYCQAVRLDPSRESKPMEAQVSRKLHVCFANLATLYMYLEDSQKAQEHISKALLLDPSNEAYLEIKRSLSAGTPTA